MERTAEQYVAIANRRKQDFYDWHELIKSWENWYYLNHYYGNDRTANESAATDRATYQHIDSAPADYVNQLLGTMTTPKLTRTIWTDDPNSKKHQALADDAEKYLAGVWQVNRKRSTNDLLRTTYFNQLVRSVAFLYVYVDEDRLALFKENNGASPDSYFPICIEWLNPLTCFPDPTPGRWSWTDQFIRAEKLTPSEVAAIWGEEKTGTVLDNDIYFEDGVPSEESEVDYLDIWEWRMKGKSPRLYNGIIYNGKWLEEMRDMTDYYQDMPVIMVPGWDLPSGEMHKRFSSPLQPMIQAVRTGERIINRVMTAAAFTANPIITTRNVRTADVQNFPGGIVPLENEQQISYLMGVSVPPILLNVFQLVGQQQNRASLSPAHYGDAPSTWSGFMLNQAILASSLKTQPIIENLCRGISTVDQHILNLTASYFPKETVGAFVTRNGKEMYATVKGGSLKGLRVTTTLVPATPNDEQARVQLAMMLRQPSMPGGDPLMTDEWIQTHILNVEDASALRTAIWKQKFMQLPTLQKYTMLQALRKNTDFPASVLAAAEQELNQMLGAGAPGQGQPPQGGPQGAPPPQGAAPQGQGGQPSVEEIMAAIDQGVQAGAISQQVADEARRRLQSGDDPVAVMEWLKTQVQGGGQQQGGAPVQAPAQEAAPMPEPPQGVPPPQEGPPMQQEPQSQIRQQIMAAMQSGQLPQDIAQQAINMLDSGASEQDVVMWLEQMLQQTQGGVAQQNAAAGASIPQGLTMEQAMGWMTQSGAPQEAIMQFQALVQQGESIDRALQQTVLAFSGVMG